MIYIEDKVIKLGGIAIKSLVQSVEISQSATIDEVEDEAKKVKTQQPTGYDLAKINVELIVEDTKTKTAKKQIEDLQKLFKPSGQTKAKVLSIVNEECNSRGISKVYFKNLSHKKNTASSKMTASLEFWEYSATKISTQKTNTSKTSSGTSSSSNTQNPSSGVTDEYKTYLNTQRGQAPKIKDKTKKSSAVDNAKTTDAKKAARATF